MFSMKGREFITQLRESNTGLIPIPSGFLSGHVNEIAAMMARHRLPAIYPIRAVQAGALLSYGNDIVDNYRRTAAFVDRILKGEKPSEIPIQFPVKFTLVINLKPPRRSASKCRRRCSPSPTR